MKKALTVILAVLFVFILSIPIFAQDMTHEAEYEIDGTIDLEKQVGHLCNTGAEQKQTIKGKGTMSKVMDTMQVSGKLTVEDTQEWVTAEDAARNLTVTSSIELCAPPKHEYTTTKFTPVFYEHTVTFQVTGSDPLENVVIQVYVDENRNEKIGDPIVTDSNGEAIIELEDGKYWFTAEHEGYDDYEGSFEVDGDATAVKVNMEQVAPKNALTVNKEGEGRLEVNGEEVQLPYSGDFEEDSTLELKAVAESGWEFYAWTGEDVDDIAEADVQNEETTITMDGDKEITAFFADETEEKYDLNFDIVTFKGADGDVNDLTGHPPYPPGFEVKLEAVPEDPDNHVFTHWGLKEGNPGNLLDASLFFEDIEDPITIFTVPDFLVTLIAHYTTWEGWKAPGEFDYDHNDFGNIKSGGGYGITQDYWDISDLDVGETINFYYYAYWIPDRFRVYYGDYNDWGNWGADTLVFDSGWVSRDPDRGENPQLYPEGVTLHEKVAGYDVVQSDRITTLNAGKYEAMIQKQEGKDVLLVETEGRDPGTLWQYIVDRGSEVTDPEPPSDIMDAEYFAENWRLMPEYNVFNRFPQNPNNDYGNCTWYAHGRMMQLGYSQHSLAVIAPPGKGNASQWHSNIEQLSPEDRRGVSLLEDDNPQIHSIAYWSGGTFVDNHVSVVEDIEYDNNGDVVSITISESHWSMGPFYQSGTIRRDGNGTINYPWPSGFIAVPTASSQGHQPSNNFSLGDKVKASANIGFHYVQDNTSQRDQLNSGEEVTVLDHRSNGIYADADTATSQYEDYHHWWFVQRENGEKGWVAETYLEISGQN